ncbi:dihydrofolate reductase family protein [Arthrobacter sp. zg-ZUI100]|uniref:dihydrofolate reductase family protein n=1 Tax=Arthrobacter jiangjiafuii TaxID=2817475 RepID=UPI001AEE9343|nr:dihydrofolate reductase family protein [Arthrobacter jiangjiafuii]MBP3037080.1 dihydrofolate reductase family protein [Arthrobacter jiangjiafuii]
MGKLLYLISCTLDGYIADETGDLSWAVPDDAMVESVTADLANVGTHLYGRRMYESMAVWETDPSLAEGSPAAAAFAESWNRAHKVVFSRTLGDIWTERTRLEREFTVEAFDRVEAETPGDLLIEGPTVTAAAFELGLVDVVSLMVYPVTVGAGTKVFPEGLKLNLRLLSEQRFDRTGMVKLTYETVRS